jgi:hypothetical protein
MREKYRVLNEDKGRIFLTCRRIYKARDSLLERWDTWEFRLRFSSRCIPSSLKDLSDTMGLKLRLLLGLSNLVIYILTIIYRNTGGADNESLSRF